MIRKWRISRANPHAICLFPQVTNSAGRRHDRSAYPGTDTFFVSARVMASEDEMADKLPSRPTTDVTCDLTPPALRISWDLRRRRHQSNGRLDQQNTGGKRSTRWDRRPTCSCNVRGILRRRLIYIPLAFEVICARYLRRTTSAPYSGV